MQVERESLGSVRDKIARLQRTEQSLLVKENRQAVLDAEASKKTLVDASPVKAPPPRAIPERLRAISPPAKPRFVQNTSLFSRDVPVKPTNVKGRPTQPKPTASWSSTPQASAEAGPSRLGSAMLAAKEEETDSGSGTGKKKGKAPRRDEITMRLIESFEFGPKEFKKDPQGGEEWMTVEPNSLIRLKSRCTSHLQVQANLTMRFYITPSELYSIVTLARDRSHFEVPVDGPWVTIVVIGAKRLLTSKGNGRALSPESEKRMEKKLKRQEEKRKEAEELEKAERDGTSAPKRQQMLVDVLGDEDDEDEDRGRIYSNNTEWKKGPRNFVRFTVSSLPSRGKNAAGGDAILSLLLFESDGTKTELGERGEKTYKGGSKGAYEKWWKLEVGDVIGIVDPRVLKPYGRGDPSGMKNPLGLGVDGPGSIFRIGKSKDMATCETIKKDGSRCEDFVDLRYSKNCDFHIENAVRGLQGGRAEFASSTSGFTMGVRVSKPAAHGRGSDSSKVGLRPRDGAVSYFSSSRVGNDAGGQLFVIGGNVVSDKKMGTFNQEFVGEKIGREKDRVLKRRREQREADEELGRLLEGEGASGTTGGRYLQAARKLQKVGIVGPAAPSATPLARPFSSEAIKRIGFNPSIYDADDRPATQAFLIPLKRPDAPISLGKVPGPRDRSSVKVPPKKPSELAAALPIQDNLSDGFVDLDSD